MKFTRIGCLVLALMVLLTAFAGCGKENASGDTSASATGTSNSTAAEKGETVTFNLLANLTPAQNTVIGRETIKKLEEKLNLKLNFDIPPSANYKERVQITLASGDLPDAILFDDTGDTSLKSGAQNGTFIDLSENLKNAPNITKYTLPGSFNAVRYLNDDKIFGIIRSTLVRADGIAFRSDWLKTLGITGVEAGKPITLDKFKEIMQKFSQNDPDGNGVNDTYGINTFVGPDGELIPLSASNPPMDVLSGVFGLNGWQKTTDEEYTYMDPRFSKKSGKFKEFMDFLNTMVENKWVDPDWPTMKSAQADDNLYKGKYGSVVAFPTNAAGMVTKLKAVNPEADLVWTSGIINPDAGKVTGTSFATGAWGCWAVTNECQNVDRLVQLFDYMLSDDFYTDDLMYGGEGIGFNTVEGKRIPTDDYKTADNIGWNRNMVRRASDTTVYLNMTFDDATRQSLNDQITTAVANVVISQDGGYIPSISTDAKFIDYKKKMNTSITKIILGEMPSSGYDEVLDGWYKAGGEEYVKDMNEHIKTVSGN